MILRLLKNTAKAVGKVIVGSAALSLALTRIIINVINSTLNAALKITGLLVLLAVLGISARMLYTIGEEIDLEKESTSQINGHIEFPIFNPEDGRRGPLESEKLSPLIRLHKKGRFSCSAAVISNRYAVTAGHCLINMHLQRLELGPIDIYDDSLKATGIQATPGGVDLRMDRGIIIGNFKKFRKFALPLDNGALIKLAYETPLVTCGFPSGDEKLCLPFHMVKANRFQFSGKAVLYPGMSGGPVFSDTTGELIAVNSSAGDDGLMQVSPLVGIMAQFGIKVKK